MCGIAGIIGSSKSDINLQSVIQDMTDSLIHRGPDDSGYAILSYDQGIKNNCIAFGHRRLKIIDLSDNAHQPMFNRNKDISIIYNGEIYNYLELKTELISKGYKFCSASDTEVILTAYEAWGADCFKRFNGMWALALFDKKRRKIILSRDRFGKKPLYYCQQKDVFLFASEIKAILRYPGVKKEPNLSKIFRYIATNYRYVDIDNQSYFKDIFLVPKSSYVEIDENLKAKTTCFWKLEDNVLERNLSDVQAINEFRDLFVDSVRLRLRSDVPVGCMLSGGMDSTSVTCVSYKILDKPIIAFSGITGEEKGVYDESEYINAVINETKANFHYIRPDPTDIFETVEEMLGFHDEPICTVTWHSLYLISKKVRLENTPVILNGHGGDEIVGGYWDYYHYNFFDLEQSADETSFKNEIRYWKENHKRDVSEIDRQKDYIKKIINNQISEMSRFPDYSQCFYDDIIQKYKKDIGLSQPMQSLLSRRMYSDLMYETVPPSLKAEDRGTMAHSLESRSPFLDYRLAEFCFSLPNRFKIRNGVGKWILREAMKGILPEDVRTRKDKAGFIAPADVWFRNVNKKQIQDLINSDSLKKRNILKIDRVNRIFEEHLDGSKNHQMFLWQLINLELWFRKFFDEE